MLDMIDIGTLEGLAEMARQRDVAEKVLLDAIRLDYEDAKIADNMEDVWKHQRCEAE